MHCVRDNDQKPGASISSGKLIKALTRQPGNSATSRDTFAVLLQKRPSTCPWRFSFPLRNVPSCCGGQSLKHRYSCCKRDDPGTALAGAVAVIIDRKENDFRLLSVHHGPRSIDDGKWLSGPRVRRLLLSWATSQPIHNPFHEQRKNRCSNATLQ